MSTNQEPLQVQLPVSASNLNASSKQTPASIRIMEETVTIFHKIIEKHYVDDEIRHNKEEDEWQQQKKDRQEKREAFQKKKEEKEKLKPAAESTTSPATAPSKNESSKPAESTKNTEEEDEEIPDEHEFEKHRHFVLKRRPPPRSDHEMRKQIFRNIKTLISTSINSEPTKVMASNPAMDELLSVSCEYCAIFRDVGIAVVVCSFACNMCAHVGARNLLDATTLVQWFLEVALLFNALKRVVHLCLLGITNAAMCKDLRLTDQMARDFAASICRLSGESRVVEAWSCAIINLVGASKSGNGAILLKHDVFSMLQRMITIHGTDDATAGRGVQALTCLSLVHFPGKGGSSTNSNAASLASSVNGSPK